MPDGEVIHTKENSLRTRTVETQRPGSPCLFKVVEEPRVPNVARQEVCLTEPEVLAIIAAYVKRKQEKP